jgi:hypothetical protein
MGHNRDESEWILRRLLPLSGKREVSIEEGSRIITSRVYNTSNVHMVLLSLAAYIQEFMTCESGGGTQIHLTW